MSRLQARVQMLEKQSLPEKCDSVVAFFLDGQLIRAEHNGQPYTGNLEGHSFFSRVEFVSSAQRSE